MTATAEALHLKDYIESRGNGIRSLADELPEDTTLSQKIADIKEYYSYVQRYHVISVLLLAPNGEAIYSTDPQYSGMHFFRSDFWKYVLAQQAASGSVASGQKDVLNPIPPFAGSADTTDWMLIGSPMLSRMNSNKPRLLGAVTILFNQYGVIPSPMETAIGAHNNPSSISLGFFTLSGFPFIHLWSNVESWNNSGLSALRKSGMASCASCHTQSDIQSMFGGGTNAGTSSMNESNKSHRN